MGFVKWYTRMLKEKPFLTKSISSFLALGSGDLLCQFLEINYFRKFTDIDSAENVNLTQEYNYKRALKQSTFGFVMSPYLHLNYNIIIPYLFPGSGITNLVKSVAYNQCVHSMFCTMVFFTYIDFLNGVEFKKSLNNAIYKVPFTVIANFKVWIPAQMINLSIMPLEYRVLFTNMVGVIWGCYLSYSQNVIANRNIKESERLVKSFKKHD